MLWRSICGLVFAMTLLVACQSAPSPSSTADPLTPLIVQSGDFPSIYHLRNDLMPWRLYPGIPQTERVYYYEIIEGTDERNEVGHITVVRYQNAATADVAYQAVRTEAETGKSVQSLELGDRGSQSGPSADWNASDILFQRCTTIVHASLSGNNLDSLQQYSAKLYDRIAPIVCP